MADTKHPKPSVPPREDRGRDDSKPIENAPEAPTHEQRHNANVTPGWGQSNQGEEDNWGNQGNSGNEGYFQGWEGSATNLPGEAAKARKLKPERAARSKP